jgi:hypothetical protein
LVASDLGRATGELHCGLIEKGDATGGVGRVDRCRQSVKQLAKIPPPVAELALRLHPLLHIPPISVLDGTAV